MSYKQALVFGSSGISGWAITRECLKYPTEDSFDRVIALSRSPIEKEEFLLPDKYIDRLVPYSGIDLSNLSDAAPRFAAIQGIEKTTHVYYTAYGGHGSDFKSLKAINMSFLRTCLSLIQQSCPNLEFLTLQTGAKTYGFEFFGQPGIENCYHPPHRESAPRLPEPYASQIFYYPQIDLLNSMERAGVGWKWCEIRPDLIIGFTPRNNGMGFAQALGVFLSMYRMSEGRGAEVVFPGDGHMWKLGRTDSGQDGLARFSILASLKGKETAGKAFNITSSEKASTWEGDWDRLCGYFGLKGVGPKEERGKKSWRRLCGCFGLRKLRPNGEGKKGVDWVMDNKERWNEWIDSNGLRNLGQVENSSWDMFAGILQYLKMDRRMDINEAKKIGWEEEEDTVNGYFRAWDRMKEAKIIA